jgi:hypothetical protein
MHLDYKLSTDWKPDAALLDEDKTTFRYSAAPGDIVLHGPAADFSTEWGWVPLRKGEEVHLTATYAPGEIKTPLSELHDSVHRLAGRLKKELVAKHPALGKHQLIEELE